MNSQFAYVVIVGEQNPTKQFVKLYIGPSDGAILSGRKDAKKYAVSTAVAIAGYMHEAVKAGHSQPRSWLMAEAQFEDGSPCPGTPVIARTTVSKAKTPAISALPEIPAVAKLSDGTYRVVPEMALKYSPNGTYFAIGYAFMHRGSPVSGYFTAPTRRELFDLIFDTKNDAVADGHGGWTNPRNPQTIAEPTREQIYRTTQLQIADSATVQKHLDLIAARDAAVATAQYELDRPPTEAEIAAVDVSPATIALMPSAVLRDKMLTDKAFAEAYRRYERAQEAFRLKAKKEADDAQAKKAADEARERQRRREAGEFVGDSYDRSISSHVR